MYNSLHNRQPYTPQLSPTTKIPNYIEDTVADVIFDIIDNDLTLGKSSEKYNVLKTTLFR
jgi:hypothetical protein